MSDNPIPTTFPGFEEPHENWSKLPHAFIDALNMVETVGELKTILYILRHTWGYHDDQKRITLDEFANGRKRRDGERIDGGTGLSIPTIRDGLDRAEAHGFIAVEVDDRDKARVKKFYSLNMAGNQGESFLQSEGKSFTIWEKKSYNRTEKDTFERNLKEDTLPPAAKEPPPSEVDIPLPGTEEPWNGPPPDAARVFQSRMHRWPKRASYRRIHETVGDEPGDLEFWGEVVAKYRDLGWNPTNVDGMLEWYVKHKLPEVTRGNGSGRETVADRNRRIIGEWASTWGGGPPPDGDVIDAQYQYAAEVL